MDKTTIGIPSHRNPPIKLERVLAIDDCNPNAKKKKSKTFETTKKDLRNS
jgi:hypothetical protein